LKCVGYDVDPLSVLMASCWTTPVPVDKIRLDADLVLKRARSFSVRDLELPWSDDATDAYARYWFADAQIVELTRLAQALRQTRVRSRDLLKLSLSRTVVTKERGASLARDVSHSRPHRVMDENDFDVYAGFLKSAQYVARNLAPDQITGQAKVSVGDATMRTGDYGSFDAAVTSPPYLNAIDYIRGHRLSLIWFGHDVASLSAVRSSQVGSERALAYAPFDVSRFVREEQGRPIGDRYVGWLRRYATDMLDVVQNLGRVVRRGGLVVVVVGNSTIRGASFDNAGVIEQCAAEASLTLRRRTEREIPPRRRYLPPPGGSSALRQRMRSESVLTFVREA
jgi:hypothetical protein